MICSFYTIVPPDSMPSALFEKIASTMGALSEEFIGG